MISAPPPSHNPENVPRRRCRLDMPPDSAQFPQPSASRVGRTLEAEAGLSGVGREALVLSERGTQSLALSAHL